MMDTSADEQLAQTTPPPRVSKLFILTGIITEQPSARRQALFLEKRPHPLTRFDLIQGHRYEGQSECSFFIESDQVKPLLAGTGNFIFVFGDIRSCGYSVENYLLNETSGARSLNWITPVHIRELHVCWTLGLWFVLKKECNILKWVTALSKLM